MDGKKAAEFSHDLQSGLSRVHVPQFDRLPLVGMASIIALHIRGLGEIQYEVLRQVADHYFDVPAMALPEVLRILDEVEYVQIISTSPTRIKSVIPQVPHFDSVYSGLGSYVDSVDLTEHEQIALEILNELSRKPDNRDTLINRLGTDKASFNTCEGIVTKGGLVVSKRARGRDILVSPAYFADSLDALADLAAAGGAQRIERMVKLLASAQGWPLSLIRKTMEVAGTKITLEELSILEALLTDGILKPPSIKSGSSNSEYFVFTPRPGNIKLGAAKREIYERAMALVAAVRKGQLLPDAVKIKWPLAILTSLRDRKKLGANSDAKLQYGNLVGLRVGRLVKTTSDRFEFHLIDNDENMEAVNQAIELVRTGDSTLGSVSSDARLALTQDEKYIQSIASAAKLRETSRVPLAPDAAAEIEQLLLNLK